MKVEDPRTGELVYIEDDRGYLHEVNALIRCKCATTEAREFVTASGAIAIWAQCLTCGRKVGGALKRDPFTTLPRADTELPDDWLTELDLRKREIAIKYIDLALAKDSAWWKAYNAYLMTPQWKGRRALVIKRCGNICEGCGSAPVAQVHHLTYAHVTNEFLFELVGLCWPCHDRLHPDEGAV